MTPTGELIAAVEQSDYLALRPDSDVREALMANLGPGESISASDLPRVPTPAGGAKMWSWVCRAASPDSSWVSAMSPARVGPLWSTTARKEVLSRGGFGLASAAAGGGAGAGAAAAAAGHTVHMWGGGQAYGAKTGPGPQRGGPAAYGLSGPACCIGLCWRAWARAASI